MSLSESQSEPPPSLFCPYLFSPVQDGRPRRAFGWFSGLIGHQIWSCFNLVEVIMDLWPPVQLQQLIVTKGPLANTAA